MPTIRARAGGTASTAATCRRSRRRADRRPRSCATAPCGTASRRCRRRRAPCPSARRSWHRAHGSTTRIGMRRAGRDGLSGYGTNCPNVGTPSVIRSRPPITVSTRTTTQAIAGAEPAVSPPAPFGAGLRGERPTVAERRYDARRALPRTCSPATSRSGTWRSARDLRAGGGRSPGCAAPGRPAPAASPAPRRAGRDSPTTSSASVTTHQLERARQRQPRAAGQRGHRAHPVAGLQRAGAQVGTPIGQPLAVAGASAGTTTTRAPPRWARQHRSRSSP